MNLTKQFKEFGLRNSINPMTRDVQTLYYNFLQLFNMAFWQPRLEVQTKTLEHLTGMSRKQIDEARNFLIQKGFIIYHKKSGSAPPEYELVFLGETQTGTQTATQKEHKSKFEFPTETQTVFTPYSNKNLNKTIKTKQLFRDSIYFDFEKFSEALESWTPEQRTYYYYAALDWSDSNHEKKMDWIATVKSWDRKEPFVFRSQNLKEKNSAKKENSYAATDHKGKKPDAQQVDAIFAFARATKSNEQ